ncbi:MAG TPA: cytochrome c biogenesis protein CcsA [Acidimicrobiales bacterium]|nr:cytochrome c biogenesis protein CcsA [Acidimicrobiales bacterium]
MTATDRSPAATISPAPAGIGSPATLLLGAAALLSLAITVIAGLGLPATEEQGPYARLIAVHPPVAWAAYLAFGVTAVASAAYLWRRTRSRTWDRVAAASAEIGIVFCALALATGSIWGRPTWGVWWTWDARLTTTALLLALFLGYLALRRVAGDVDTRARRSAIAALIAAADIPIVHFSVDWWRTLHQGRSLAQLTPQSDLDGSYITVMLVGLVAMTLTYGWLLVHRYRVEVLEERLEVEGLDLALEQRRAEAGSGESHLHRSAATGRDEPGETATGSSPADGVGHPLGVRSPS